MRPLIKTEGENQIAFPAVEINTLKCATLAIPDDVDVGGWKWDCVACTAHEGDDDEDVESCARTYNDAAPLLSESDKFIYHVTNIPCPTCEHRLSEAYTLGAKSHALLAKREAKVRAQLEVVESAITSHSALQNYPGAGGVGDDHSDIPAPTAIFTTIPNDVVYDQSNYGIPHAFFTTSTWNCWRTSTESPLTFSKYPRGGKNGRSYLRVSTTLDKCTLKDAKFYYLHGDSQRFFLCRPKDMKALVEFAGAAHQAIRLATVSEVFTVYATAVCNIAIPDDVDVRGWEWDCVACRSLGAHNGDGDVESCGRIYNAAPSRLTESDEKFIYHVTNIPCPKCSPDLFEAYKQSAGERTRQFLTERKEKVRVQLEVVESAIDHMTGQVAFDNVFDALRIRAPDENDNDDV
jgi:hypothetical protein